MLLCFLYKWLCMYIYFPAIVNEPVRSHPHKIGTDSSQYFSLGHQRNCQPLISAGTFPVVALAEFGRTIGFTEVDTWLS
jgi:hypothetical protein